MGLSIFEIFRLNTRHCHNMWNYCSSYEMATPALPVTLVYKLHWQAKVMFFCLPMYLSDKRRHSRHIRICMISGRKMMRLKTRPHDIFVLLLLPFAFLSTNNLKGKFLESPRAALLFNPQYSTVIVPDRQEHFPQHGHKTPCATKRSRYESTWTEINYHLVGLENAIIHIILLFYNNKGTLSFVCTLCVVCNA